MSKDRVCLVREIEKVGVRMVSRISPVRFETEFFWDGVPDKGKKRFRHAVDDPVVLAGCVAGSLSAGERVAAFIML